MTLRFVQGDFVDAYDPGICDVYRREEQVDGNVVLYEIVDTAGQEEYGTLRREYYRAAEGFVLLYSVTDPHSVTEARRHWDEVCMERGTAPPCVVVAHKCDLIQYRSVPEAEGDALARHCGAELVEASARHDINVARTFHAVAAPCVGLDAAATAAVVQRRSSRPPPRLRPSRRASVRW